MIELFEQINSLDELAIIFLENWESINLDNISSMDLLNLKKILLEKRFISFAKRLSDLEKFAYNRFNLTKALLNELDPDTVCYHKLKFALWHKIITNKTISFMETAQKANRSETVNNLSIILGSLNSIKNVNKPISKIDISKKFVILSDIASQLGFQMFSLISAKKSVRIDPKFADAIFFMGKAYLELGQIYSARALNNKTSDQGSGTYEFNLLKSKEVFSKCLEQMNGEKKKFLEELIYSVANVLEEISNQKKQNKNTVVQVVVEDFIKDKLSKVEDLVIKEYGNQDFKFASNVKEEAEVFEEVLLLDDQKITSEEKAKDSDTLSVIKESEFREQNTPKKAGNLYNIYNNTINYKKEDQPAKKTGKITQNSVGYKLKLEDLQKLIAKKNEEINKNRNN